jgi:hypothetical protein
LSTPLSTPPRARFEDRLLTAILTDFDQLAGPQAARRTGRRRAVPALIAGAAAAALAAAGVATLGTNSTDGTHAARHATRPALASPVVHTAAYVVAHMRAALNANTAVMVVVSRAPDSQTGRPVTDETWSVSGGDTYRDEQLTPAGRPVTGDLVTITAHRTVSITVNYRARTWTEATYRFGSASSGVGPAPRAVTPEAQADQLRAQVKAGQVTLAGRAFVDGQSALYLREYQEGGLIRLWVSPATYLPIREIDTAAGVPENSPQAIRNDYRWLPASPASLRLLTPAAAIPAGFTRVG